VRATCQSIKRELTIRQVSVDIHPVRDDFRRACHRPRRPYGVDENVWARATKHFSLAEILDLSMLTGLYGLVGRLTNALAVPLDDEILPISAVDSLL
jgi:hypothetical protein